MHVGNLGMTDHRRFYRSRCKPLLYRHRRPLLIVLIVIAATLWITTSPAADDVSQLDVLSTQRQTQDEFVEAVAVNTTHKEHSGKASSHTNSTAEHLLFKEKPLVIWSSNFHPSPVADIKNLLEPLGVRFIIKDLSSKYCEHFNTCSSTENGEHQSPLKVIDKDNILAMNHLEELIPAFHAAYHNDTEMQSVDAFLCCDPPGACELFEPFNKSVIIVATTR